MKHVRIAIAATIALLIVGSFSCAKPPVAEMASAEAAFAKAESDADARAYAPDSIAKAKDILGRMQAESAAKRYDQAKTLAAEASEASEKAIRDGASGKAKAKGDASSAVAEAKSALAETESALGAAKKVRRLALDLAAVGREIEDASKTLAGAESDLAKSDFKSAITKAQVSRSALAGVQKRIADAVLAASRKK